MHQSLSVDIWHLILRKMTRIICCGQINSMTPFELKEEQILVGTHGQYTPAIGAALFYVKEFIQSV